MFCAKCGSDISEGLQFCPVCGEKIGAGGTAETTGSPDAPSSGGAAGNFGALGAVGQPPPWAAGVAPPNSSAATGKHGRKASAKPRKKMAKLRLALIIAGSAIALLAAAFTLLVAFRPFQPEADSPLAGIYNAVVGSLSISPAMRSR